MLSHLPNFSDVAFLDYHLFNSLKHFLSGEKVEEKISLINENSVRSTHANLQICPLDGKLLLIRRVII